ncbi:MAG: hypothetical protein ABWY04_14260 [Arthrobacter sp.]
MLALKLSFVLRYQMDVLSSVVISLGKLEDINLAGEDIVDKVMASTITRQAWGSSPPPPTRTRKINDFPGSCVGVR